MTYCLSIRRNTLFCTLKEKKMLFFKHQSFDDPLWLPFFSQYARNFNALYNESQAT